MKYDLKFGEAKMIADECNVSITTFNKAMRGETTTPLAKVIVAHTELIVKQREERLQKLKDALESIKSNKNG